MVAFYFFDDKVEKIGWKGGYFYLQGSKIRVQLLYLLLFVLLAQCIIWWHVVEVTGKQRAVAPSFPNSATLYHTDCCGDPLPRNHKIISLLLCNCNSGTVMSCNINI